MVENRHVDTALDKLSEVEFFDKLPDLHKLILLSQDSSNNEEKLKKLSLTEIYKELGGTFGRHQIKVKIKESNQQPIKHKLSQEAAGKDGYLANYISNDDNNQAYVGVSFEEFLPHDDAFGGGVYRQWPIYLENMYPVGYDDENPVLQKHEARIAQERKEFQERMQNGGLDDLTDNLMS